MDALLEPAVVSQDEPSFVLQETSNDAEVAADNPTGYRFWMGLSAFLSRWANRLVVLLGFWKGTKGEQSISRDSGGIDNDSAEAAVQPVIKAAPSLKQVIRLKK